MKLGIIFALMYFFMALIVVIIFISPMNTFLNIAQQSNFLNCQGYIHNGNISDPLSFNASLNANSSGNPIACLTLKLYLPYILLVFLVGGISAVLGGRTADFLGSDESGGGDLIGGF